MANTTKNGNEVNAGLETRFKLKKQKNSPTLSICNFHGDYSHDYLRGKTTIKEDGKEDVIHDGVTMEEYFKPESNVVKVAVGDTNSHQGHDLAGLMVDYAFATSYEHDYGNIKSKDSNLRKPHYRLYDQHSTTGQQSAHDGMLLSAPTEFGVFVEEEGREIFINHGGTIKCAWQKTVNNFKKGKLFQGDHLPKQFEKYRGITHQAQRGCRWFPKKLFGEDFNDNEAANIVRKECAKRIKEQRGDPELAKAMKKYYSIDRYKKAKIADSKSDASESDVSESDVSESTDDEFEKKSELAPDPPANNTVKQGIYLASLQNSLGQKAYQTQLKAFGHTPKAGTQEYCQKELNKYCHNLNMQTYRNYNLRDKEFRMPKKGGFTGIISDIRQITYETLPQKNLLSQFKTLSKIALPPMQG